MGRGEHRYMNVGVGHGANSLGEVNLTVSNREPLTILDGIKRSMGGFNFSAQYQQRLPPPRR
jgi:hypothetical protein